MATTYNINYHLTNCTNTGSSTTYTNDSATRFYVVAQAADGCKFVKGTTDLYYTRYRGSSFVKTDVWQYVPEVSSSEYYKVKNGSMVGVTMDGKYLSFWSAMGSTNSSDMEFYIGTQGTPVTPEVTITNNVSDTTATQVYNSSDGTFTITVTGGETGKFDSAPVMTWYDSDGTLQTTTMTLSDSHTATATVAAKENTTVTITGEYAPITYTLDITNNVSGTTATQVYNSGDGTFTITVTGGETGMFDSAPVMTWYNKYSEIQSTAMTLSDSHTATATVAAKENTTVTITGEYTPVIHTLDITNNITGTSAKYTTSGTNFIVTVTGDVSGEFDGTPLCTYGGNDYSMNVDGITATITIPYTVTECTLTGTFTPVAETVPIKYALENCTVTPSPTTIEKGGTLTAVMTPNTGYQLKTANLQWVGNESHVIAIDLTTGEINFTLPGDCISIGIVGTAEIIKPVGTNYGCINVYNVSLDNLNAFSQLRFFTESEESESGVTNVDLGVYVNRIQRIYANVPVIGSDTLKCGNYNTGITVAAPETDIVTLDYGDVEITGINGDSNDFNAALDMLLPCNGFAPVDSGYIGKTINLTIKVNIITGDGLAVLSYNGTPFQYSQVTLSKDILYRTSTNETSVIGGDTWDESNMYGFEPYILMKSTETIYAPVHSTRDVITIGDVTGYSEFENVVVIVENCLSDEYTEIINKLTTGVYI